MNRHVFSELLSARDRQCGRCHPGFVAPADATKTTARRLSGAAVRQGSPPQQSTAVTTASLAATIPALCRVLRVCGSPGTVSLSFHLDIEFLHIQSKMVLFS